MRLYEINTKYFRFSPGTVELFESYNSPSTELIINFTQKHIESGNYYFEGIVTEQATGDEVIFLDFTIYEKYPTTIIVDNIRPNLNKIDQNKIVNTTLGPQIGGVDMGYTAIKWVFREIKQFALRIGFDIKNIESSNRYTGARAKNNPSDKIDHFDVNAKLEEHFNYNCKTEVLDRTVK